MKSKTNQASVALVSMCAATIQTIRRTERAITRSRSALEPILAHAVAVEQFDAAVREAGLPIKLAYKNADLDYQLAKHATWIAETVGAHETAHPQIASFGPSLVLLVREAERRFAKEDRSGELPGLISDIADGMSRRAVREKHLPPKPQRGRAAVLAAVRAGRMEPARRAFEECDEEERKALRVLARGLSLIIASPDEQDKEAGDEPHEDGQAPARSIEEALLQVAS